MSSTGLLVVSNVKHIGKTLHSIEKYVRTLYIHLNIPDSPTGLKQAGAPAWGKVVSQLYADSSCHIRHSNYLDLRILLSPFKGRPIAVPSRPIDIMFSDSHATDVCETLRAQLNIPKETIYLNKHIETTQNSQTSSLLEEAASEPTKDLAVYDSVVLGGTFDRIHPGHKIFLTQAVLRAGRRLVIGVTTDKMIKSKTLWELILPVEERIRQLREFLMDIDPSLHYDIVPIDDPFGPTKSDPDMDMIVVSEETLRGGHKVNEIRRKNGLKSLEIFCIEVVESAVVDGPRESKISSSNSRIDLLGTRLRSPEPPAHLALNPYVIGLTGGIASGKSKMAKCFADLGAIVMDCDKIAHEIYEPGQVCYEKIIRKFGDVILSEVDARIDRRKLGSIVFGDPSLLEALNNIVWPELIVEVNRRIRNIAGQLTKPTVIVIEAAVLLRAGWETQCHEVWSMIVSRDEAVRRLKARNNLSEEEATKRIDSQLSNQEIVARSHVVFSSEWEESFTQQQAQKAWTMLMAELQGKHANKGNQSSML